MLDLEDDELILKLLIKYKSKNKQQKYLSMIDITNVYMKIMNKINFLNYYNGNALSENSQTKFNQIQRIYEEYINEQISINGNDNNVPILVKLCYRLFDLHKLIWTTKDLMVIRDYCIEFKQRISSDLTKDNLNKIRKESIEQHSKPRNTEKSERGTYKTVKKTLKKKSYFQEKDFSPQTSIQKPLENQKIQLPNSIEQEYLQVSKQYRLRQAQQKKVSIQPYIQQIQQQFPFQNLRDRLNKIPTIQQYIKIFYWKINSCLLLINEVQHKNIWSKHQFIDYIKMGQWLKNKYLNTVNQITILSQIITIFSSILTHAYHLKQHKYYDMIILQLQIAYKRIKKLKTNKDIILTNNNMPFINQQSYQKIANKSNVNIYSKINFNSNASINTNFYSNTNVNSIIKNKLSTNKNTCSNRSNLGNYSNLNQSVITTQINKITKNVSFKSINYNSLTKENDKSRQPKSQHKKRQLPIYKQIDDQLKKLQQKQTKQQLNKYMQQPNINKLQQKINEIQNQKIQRCQFNKNLSFLTQQSKSILIGCNFNQGKFVINLDQIKQSKNNRYRHQKYYKSNHKNTNNQTVRSAYNVLQVALMMKQQQNIQKNRGSERSIRTARKALILNEDLFKKQISNILQIKRMIKPCKYFQNIKDKQNNIYRQIISTQQHLIIITKQSLQKQLINIYQIFYQKPVPLLSQIIMLAKIKDKSKNNNIQKEKYNFQKIYQTMTNTDNQQIIKCYKKNNMLEITIIQCVSRQIGFIKIRINRDKNYNQNQILFTSQDKKIYQQNITIIQRPSENQKKNKKDELKYKKIFNFDQLKYQIVNSQFYFQLIQQKIQNKFQNQDAQKIQSYINQLQNNKIRISQCSQSFNQDDDPIIKQKNKQNTQLQSLVVLGMSRISHALLCWYYTKANKINGNILIKRQIPYISNQIKFTIALEFMKKYRYKQCLERLGNVRNKVALYECLKYLLYGKKIFVKGLTTYRKNIVFYTLSLERFKDLNFQIRTKQQGGSQFRDLQFILTLYNTQNWSIINSYKYPIQRVLGKQKITLMMLSNIIQHTIPHQYLQQLIKDIEQRQLDSIKQDNQDWQLKDYKVIQPISQQKINMIKLYANNQDQSKNIIIINFIHLIAAYVSLSQGSINFTIKDISNRVVKIAREYMSVKQVYLGGGVILQIIKNTKNKGKYQQILILQQSDFKQIQQSNINHKYPNQKYSNLSLHYIKINKFNKVNKTCSKIQNKQENKVTNSQELLQLQKNIYNIDKQHKQYKQCKYSYKIIKSPYNSRISIINSISPIICLTNHINKCIIQKQQLDLFQILNKKIIKINNKFIYMCLSFIHLINSYRIDVYQMDNSKRWAALFRIEQYQSQKQQNSLKIFGENNMQEFNQQSFYSNFNEYNCQNKKNVVQKQDDNHNDRKINTKSIYKISNNSQKSKKLQDNEKVKNNKNPNQFPQQTQKHKAITKLFKNNKIQISQHFKYLTFISKPHKSKLQKNTEQIKIPLFQVFNNITSLKGYNKGRIQLIEINSKIILLILLLNQQNIYFNVVDDNPFMNHSANLFADCHVKDHRINLYTDLFMRLYIKFLNNGITITQMKNLMEIANL